MTVAGHLLRGFLVALGLAWAAFLAYCVAAPKLELPPVPLVWSMALLGGAAVLLVVGAVALMLITRRSVAVDADVLVAVAGVQAGKARKRLLKALAPDTVGRVAKSPATLDEAWDLFAEDEVPLMVWRPAVGPGVLLVADLPWLEEMPWPPRQPQALEVPDLPVEAWSELGLFVRGLSELQRGESATALETWAGLDSLAEASAIWQGLAWESEENLESARDWYASVDLTEARFNLARCQTLLGETQAAIALWQEILRQEPGCGAAAYWLGSLYRDLGRPQDAVQILQPAADDDAPACWALAGDILGDVGAWGLAGDAYSQALDRAATDGELWRRYGLALEKQGRLTDGIEATEYSVELEPSAANMTQWGHQLGMLGRWEAALPLFERSHELDDEYPEALYRWAQALEELCRWDEAVALYEKLLTLHRSYAAARLSLATLLARQGKLEAATEHFSLALTDHPQPADVHLRWATALAQGGNWAEAMWHLEEVTRLDPRSAFAYHYLGLGLMHQDRAAESLRFFRRAYELEPANVPALIDWGIALGQLGHVEKAMARFEAAIAQSPGNQRALYNLGVAHDRLGRFEVAAATFRTLLRHHPDDAQAHYDLGRALKKLGLTDEAMTHTQHALRLMDAAGTAKS